MQENKTKSRGLLGCPKPIGRYRRNCDKCFEAGFCLEKRDIDLLVAEIKETFKE